MAASASTVLHPPPDGDPLSACDAHATTSRRLRRRRAHTRTAGRAPERRACGNEPRPSRNRLFPALGPHDSPRPITCRPTQPKDRCDSHPPRPRTKLPRKKARRGAGRARAARQRQRRRRRRPGDGDGRLSGDRINQASKSCALVSACSPCSCCWFYHHVSVMSVLSAWFFLLLQPSVLFIVY